FEPGARLVLTHGFGFKPRAAALRARRPAPSMTAGFDVFVQLVIAAITTAPSSSSNDSFANCAGARVGSAPSGLASRLFALPAAERSAMRSCGRFGPAMLGSTL